MRNVYCFLIFSISMSSCASILNKPYQHVTVYTTGKGRIVVNKDTISTRGDQVTLRVQREKGPLKMVALTDSSVKNITVKSNNSFWYWSNILYNYGIGMLVEKKQPKRYSFPTNIYINLADTIDRFYRHPQKDRTGELRLHVSLPHINSFLLKPEGEGKKSNTGFWGLTIGLDFFHSKNQFLNAGVSGVSDFLVPFPAPVHFGGEYEIMSSRYVSLSNNHQLGRFSLGYGLTFAKNTWDLRVYGPPDPQPGRDPVKKHSHSLGFVFPAYYKFGKSFHLGAVYRPTFLRTGSGKKSGYEHLVSIDFAWKIRLRKQINENDF